MTEKEAVYKSNLQILFSDLRQAVNDYIGYGHTHGEVKYINAYLMAVLGAIAAYKDTVLKGQKESDEIKACKYANNMLKHDPSIITMMVPSGGATFPISFPLEIPEINIIWKWLNLESKHEDQKKAFKKLFVGEPVLDTLQMVLTHLGIDI